MFLKCQNKCDDSIKRSKCTIFNQYALYEPPHQFGGPDSFQAKHCGKSKDVLKFVCIIFFIVQSKSLRHKHIKPFKNYSHKYNCFVSVWTSHLELFFQDHNNGQCSMGYEPTHGSQSNVQTLKKKFF